ncbi:MAG: acyl carrier protein [Pirellulales bacterium]|nr:acyl carrier protein [Pirellulales bacterium]
MLSEKQSAPIKLDRGQVFEAVKAIVAEHATFSAAEIRPEHHLENDLGCDSLDIVEISMEIEEHFDISIPDEISEQTKTVGSIVEGVMQLLKRG